MAAKDRRETIPVKATTQAWFKGTFTEADDVCDSDSDLQS